LDADTIILKNINELFDLAKEHHFVVPQFTDWTCATKPIIKRIKSWYEYYPELCENIIGDNNFKAVNCGVFSFKHNSDFALNWYDKIIQGRNNFIPDETGMQVLLQNYKHLVCDQKFNVSCKYSNPYSADTSIIHYHGRKHCRMDDDNNLLYSSELWVKVFNEVNSMNYGNINEYIRYDRMLTKFINRNNKPQIDKSITMVTAVNPPYLNKLRTVLPTWQLKPQLADCKLIIMHNGFSDPENELSFIKEITGRDVELVEWNMDNYSTTRELMLSSFVFLAPKVVKTGYWLKLDADTYFSDEQDLILDHFYKYDIAGHKWKYTKPGKWICDLDEWAFDEDLSGNNYLNDDEYKNAYDNKRYGHNRIASFCCLHKTEFTIEIMDHLNEKLPIPSHDTFLWYMSNRLPDRKWCWHSFKKLGCNNKTNPDELLRIVSEIRNKYEI
jgi:hypothetical protein